MKPKLEDILKNPESFKVKPVDYSKDKKKMKELKKVIRETKERYKYRPTVEAFIIAQQPMTI